MICPKCQKEHDDNFEVKINGIIYKGGCVKCRLITVEVIDLDENGYNKEGEQFYPWHNVIGRKF